MFHVCVLVRPMKHYTKPINRLKQKAIRRLEGFELWYLNAQINNRLLSMWHWHPHKWWIRVGIIAFIIFIIWAV